MHVAKGAGAQHFHAELYLLNVIPFFSTTTVPDLIPEAEFINEARAYAERHFAKCHAVLLAKGVKSTSSVEVGNNVAGNIMEVAEREHIDMVVISTHGDIRLAFVGVRVDCREGRKTRAVFPPASALSQT